MRAPIDWAELELLHALARHGTMRAAGAALGVNHATLSRRLAALEARLQTPLLARAGRGVALTAEGRRLAGVAARMDAARAEGDAPEWVGVRAPAVGWPLLARAVAAAQGVRPRLGIRQGDDLVLHLESPQDAAAEPIGRWRLVPVGPVDRWVAGPGWRRRDWRQAHLRAPVVAQVETPAQVHALVTAGVGGGLLPPGLVGSLGVQADLPALEGTLWLTRTGQGGPAADHLLEHLRAASAATG